MKLNFKKMTETTVFALNRVGLKLKKYSPEITLVVGIALGGAAIVTACMATLKAPAIMNETNEKLEKIHEAENDMDEKAYRKELTSVYIRSGASLAKIYAPSALMATMSLTSILASHKIMKNRNVALGAAYAAADMAFKEYRQGVVKRFGSDADQEIRHHVEEVKEIITDEKSGKTREDVLKTAPKKEAIYNPQNKYSEYARVYDEASRYFESDLEPEFNLMFLRQRQQWANDMLRTKGHVFLNEVYDSLDLPRSKAGQIVGWVYDPNNPTGDTYIDFGIYDLTDPAKRRFINSDEPYIILDFNVQGNILDLI